MWFFKKKNKNSVKGFVSEEKQKILEEAKKQGKINNLSQKQIDKIIENNRDVAFLISDIQKEMDEPDISFLTEKLMPNLKEHNERKDVFDEDIFYAVALGDIIGAPLEFRKHDYAKVSTLKIPDMNSSYTDDSVLTLATLRAIQENAENPDFRKWYLSAYKKYPDVGYGASFIAWANNAIDNHSGYHSIGDGCAMRASCIASYYDNVEDVIQHTIESVMVTHNHVESIKGTVVLNVCIWMALHSYTKEEIYEYVRKHYVFTKEDREKLIYKKFFFNIDINWDDVSNEETNDSLYVTYAVPYALRCFYDTNSYDECMKKILSKFCDADTICAIAGGLCIAYYGTQDGNIKTVAEKYLKTLNL